MNNETRLCKVFQQLFDVDSGEINDESSQDTIPKWDSLGMVNLVSELEREFSVQFELLEIADFKTVGIIKSILKEKGVSFD